MHILTFKVSSKELSNPNHSQENKIYFSHDDSKLLYFSKRKDRYQSKRKSFAPSEGIETKRYERFLKKSLGRGKTGFSEVGEVISTRKKEFSVRTIRKIESLLVR